MLCHNRPVAPEIEQRLRTQVLPLFRSRNDLHRWRAANEFGSQAHDGVDLLERAGDEAALVAAQRAGAANGSGAGGFGGVSRGSGKAAADPFEEVHGVRRATEAALRSLGRVLLRADDSSGIIGDAYQRLLVLHPRLAELAPPPPAKLVAWMLAHDYPEGDDAQDFFELDPVRYAAALGPKGMARYRAALDAIEVELPTEPTDAERRAAYLAYQETRTPEAYAAYRDSLRTVSGRGVLARHRRRLAVADRDIEAIIVTHVADGVRAHQLHEAAQAFAEIERPDLAIEWAERAAYLTRDHQAVRAAEYWCALLHAHRPGAELAARRAVFERWPGAALAAALRTAAGAEWAALEPAVLTALEARPEQLVGFLLHSLHDAPRAWAAAHRLDLEGDRLWSELADAYQRHDPVAVLPVLERLLLAELVPADSTKYRGAAKRVQRYLGLAAGAGERDRAEAFAAELRERYRRRPSLLAALDRAGV